MGIISIKSSDNLFWLGRYVERVFTTLKAFTECYDIMIDINDDEYVDFCRKLGIANNYSCRQEFISSFLFDQNDPASIYSSLLHAYDNAVEMRNVISSDTLSYLQLAVDIMEKSRGSNVPLLKVQEVTDWIFAFWGSADDNIEAEGSRNILKFGRSIERLDLYTRLGYPQELMRKEFSIMLNRLYKVGIDFNPHSIERLTKMILEEDDYEPYKYSIQNELAQLFVTGVV